MKLNARKAGPWILTAVMAAAGLASSSCSLDLSTTTGGVMIRGRALKGLRSDGHEPVTGYVQLVRPGGSETTAWSQYTFDTSSGVPNKVTTDADGYFTFWIEETVFEFSSTEVFFLSFTSEDADTFSLLAPIPSDLLIQDGLIPDFEISPETTLASTMICPGGVYPAPSGAYCYEQITQAEYREELVQIDASLEDANSALTISDTDPDWPTFITDFLTNDTGAFDFFEAWIEVEVEISWEITVVTTNFEEPPTVTEPTTDDLNDAEAAEEESGGGGSCDPGHFASTCPSGAVKCCPNSGYCCFSSFTNEEICNPNFCD